MGQVIVIRPGFLTTVQDRGRPRSRRFGISSGGAVDAHALRVANLLVGNEDSAAGLEITLGGLRVRFSDERCIAWCGGDFDVRIGDLKVPAGRAASVAPGEDLNFAGPESGCRAWLAVSGGIDAPIVLGSRATDLRGSFGGFEGRALREGDALPLGAPPVHPKINHVADWGAPSSWASLRSNNLLRIVRGADWLRFPTAEIEVFLSRPSTVSADSDRMGLRLDGPPLRRCDDGADLISEAVAPGTIQIPPGGNPILLLADSQTIGGYPKIAHVITVDLPIAAQLRPGDSVSFQETTIVEAQRLLLQRESDLARFRIGLSLRS